MITPDSTDEEIQDYILEREDLNVDILGKSMYRGQLMVFVTWEREMYLDRIRQIVSSIRRDGTEIIDQYINRQTTRYDRRSRRCMRSLHRYIKKYNLPDRLVDIRFPGHPVNLPHDLVQVRIYNVYMICFCGGYDYGSGCFKFGT